MKQRAALLIAVGLASSACNQIFGVENRDDSTHSAAHGGNAGGDGVAGALAHGGSSSGSSGQSSSGSSGQSSSGSSGRSSSGSSGDAAGSSTADGGGASAGAGPSTVADCGNGVSESPEECDDHNELPWDGCGATCLIERGWLLNVNGILSPAFDPAHTSYALKLPLFTDTLELTARAPDATFKVGTTAVDSAETFFLGSGTRKVELKLLADGTVQRTFTLNVQSGAAVQALNVPSAVTSGTFGSGVALSADGNRLVVGTPYDEVTKGNHTGAVYIFERSPAGSWLEKGKVSAETSGPDDGFGEKVAISADGTVLAVTALGEDGSATSGSNGNAPDELAEDSGAVYLFSLVASGKWEQKAYLKVPAGQAIGGGLSLSGNGAVLAVGAYGMVAPNTASPRSESVCVFRRESGGAWLAEACVKAFNADEGDAFGTQVALSEDGATLAVSAPGESSISVAAPQDNSVGSSGAAYVFTRSPQLTWEQRAFLKASDAAYSDGFGTGLALSGDGQTIAVGAYYRRDAENNAGAGAVYLFGRSANQTWREQKFIQQPVTHMDDWFGYSVALNRDGTSLAVGSVDSGDLGYPPASGAVRVFLKSFGEWRQEASLKSPLPHAYSGYGRSALAWSADGQELAIGALGESGNGGALLNSGAVYVMH
ncbi:MAG TPA: hypothetical protein VJV79_31160 [Polyangiaceae bacterium]|nr:hypothetical protein [Polyangiaceae bacterium]